MWDFSVSDSTPRIARCKDLPSIVVEDAVSCRRRAALRPAGVVMILGIASAMGTCDSAT